MSSQIEPLSIDATYPVPGVNNSAQGLRKNFDAIQKNFTAARDEINDLMNKVVVKADLTNNITTNGINDLNGMMLSNAVLKDTGLATVNLGESSSASSTITVDVSQGSFQTITLNTIGTTRLTFVNWRDPGTYSEFKLRVVVSEISNILALPSTKTYLNTDYISEYNSLTKQFSFTRTGSYDYVFSTVDGGETISIFTTINTPENFIQDSAFDSFTDAMTAAVASSKVLVVTQSHTLSSSVSSAANLMFLPGGKIVVSGNHTLTLTGKIFSFAGQIFDYDPTLGTIILPPSVCIIPEWFGVVGDNSTDNTLALAKMAKAGCNFKFQSGTDTNPVIYKSTTWPTWRNGTNIEGGGSRATILRPWNSSDGILFNGTTNVSIRNIGICPDNNSNYALNFQDAISVEVSNVLIGDPVVAFGLTRTGSCAAAAAIRIASVASNSFDIAFRNLDISYCANDGVLLYAIGSDGNSGINFYSGHIHGNGGWGINNVGAGSGAHEIHVHDTIIEGNTAGEINVDAVWDMILEGLHIEHVNGTNFTVNTSSSGNTVSWVSGAKFNSQWKTVTIGSTIYEVNNVVSNTSLTLKSSPGNQTGVALKTPVIQVGLSLGVARGCSISRCDIGGDGSGCGIYVGHTGAQSFQVTQCIFANIAQDAVHFIPSDYAVARSSIALTHNLYTGINLYNANDDLNISNMLIYDSSTNGTISTLGDGTPWTMSGAINYLTVAASGSTNNAIKMTFSNLPKLEADIYRNITDGMVIRVKLPHTLQAGANTLALNSGSARSIKSSRNPANNIATGYVVGGVITLCWNSTSNVWLDLSQ